LGSGVDIAEVVMWYVCLLFSLSVHEAAHAIMADRCGDPTGRMLGRATLNPIAHIDPIGTVVLPLLMMVSNVPYLFGWAKPVPFNPRNLRNPRRDIALVGIAGPMSNLLLILIFTIVLRVFVLVSGDPVNTVLASPLGQIMFIMILMNVVLMLFNLIPVPPLDGHHLLHLVLPPSATQAIERIGPFGIIIVIVVISPMLRTPIGLLMKLVVWFIAG